MTARAVTSQSSPLRRRYPKHGGDEVIGNHGNYLHYSRLELLAPLHCDQSSKERYGGVTEHTEAHRVVGSHKPSGNADQILSLFSVLTGQPRLKKMTKQTLQMHAYAREEFYRSLRGLRFFRSDFASSRSMQLMLS